MKGPSFYFQKMSLTRQILTIILTVLMFFIMFFFVFVSDNIDRTITKQMYELILNRQTQELISKEEIFRTIFCFAGICTRKYKKAVLLSKNGIFSLVIHPRLELGTP